MQCIGILYVYILCIYKQYTLVTHHPSPSSLPSDLKSSLPSSPTFPLYSLYLSTCFVLPSLFPFPVPFPLPQHMTTTLFLVFMGRTFITWRNSQKKTQERKRKQERNNFKTMYYNTKHINYHHSPKIIHRKIWFILIDQYLHSHPCCVFMFFSVLLLTDVTLTSMIVKIITLVHQSHVHLRQLFTLP